MKTRTNRSGFTLLEMMAAIVIIMILAGIVVGITGAVQNKASKARATAEKSQIESAVENYKADFGTVPRSPTDAAAGVTEGPTDKLKPRTDFKPTDKKYEEASLDLYRELANDKEMPYPNGVPDDDSKRYLREHDPRLIKTSGTGSNKEVKYFQDPWGFPYGYSTAAYKKEREYQVDLKKAPATAVRPSGDDLGGFNTATADIWSTAGNTAENITDTKTKENEWAKWIKNW